MLTFVIPVGHYHEAAAENAIASCLAQTILSRVVVVYDAERRGAGWARNRGLDQVSTPFVSFLDADDWIETDYAEKCLLAYDGRHYVYTDWYESELVTAPCRPWDGSGAHHIITTLLPTAAVRAVGGFDETLTGMEDTDLYWKLTRAGLCGKRLPEALFHYGAGGRRAQAFRDRPDREALSKSILDRYKGQAMPCTDCGGNPIDIHDLPPSGEQLEGDVLAEALWHGNRQERGRVTRRLYPKSGWHKRLWVAPEDIDAAPNLFARVVELPAPVTESDLNAFRQFTADVNAAFGMGKPPTVQTPAPAYAQRGEVAPDVDRVLRLYQQTK